ncbi:phenylacetic acid degradation protein PaaD [Zafaria cholistanensis]|uniref:Phenylacetic acid degradation protein PaaD n=1 Tax=Zafaria cholistanensis TaxID=1682741 RepID=A0A5A7NPB5_9MICC|nr:hydroxyphenylacetyl-CoA thioesterase PaaI [Zafaria cholistanensis]GER22499.1 phenylacetic acid degradation protein PaaD [Zafaria cholistanensis]
MIDATTRTPGPSAPEREAGTRPAHPILVNDYATEWMGIQVQEVGDGHATITMELRREMLNGFGIAHGGMIFALADTAFALACNPHTGSTDTITVAAGADINFLRPGIPGRTLTAAAERRNQSGRTGIYDVQVLQSVPDGEDEVIAEFRGCSRTLPKR